MKYLHLTYEQRCQIYILKESGKSLREIAKILCVHHSTIIREIQRNSGQRGYRYQQAQRKAEERRHKASSRPKKLIDSVKLQLSDLLLSTQSSPVQACGRLFDQHGIKVSHESLYKMIWADKKAGGTLYVNLRRKHKKYNKRSGKNAGRGLIPNRVGIEHRPQIVENKERFGDFELDTIVGANHKGAIISIVDRASKFVYLKLVQKATAQNVQEGICQALTSLRGNGIIQTFTSDNGKEFAAHEKIVAELGGSFYFANPYCSWERGLNEHTNGLVRQYIPKKTDFKTLTDADVRDIEKRLNNRPRAVLKFKTPLEVFNKFMEKKAA